MILLPVLPVAKPGKNPANIESYRQISLLESLFKLYEKLVHLRIQGTVKRKLLPWQVGGSLWADECAWLLHQILVMGRPNLERCGVHS